MSDEPTAKTSQNGQPQEGPQGHGEAEYAYFDEDGNPVEPPPGGLDSDDYEVVEADASPARNSVGGSATPPPSVFRSRGPVMFSALGIGLVAVAGILWWVFIRESEPSVLPNGPGKPGSVTCPPQAKPEDNTAPAVLATVAVEAEPGRALAAPFQVASDDQASGKLCLTLPAKSCAGGQHVHLIEDPASPRRTDGSVQIPFEIKRQGDYFLWIRKWWCCAEGDSFIVEVDGGRSYIFGDDGAGFRQWSWLDLRDMGHRVKFPLGPGKHVLLVRSRGESGFRIDQVLLTTDPKLAPTVAVKTE